MNINFLQKKKKSCEKKNGQVLYYSDFCKKSQLYSFLERAVREENIFSQCNKWAKLMNEVARMYLDPAIINHLHALLAALAPQRWRRRLNLETCCLDVLSCFYTAQQWMCYWCFGFYSECQQHLFSIPVCSPHYYSPTYRMFLAQWWYVSMREMMSSMQQQAYYLKKRSNIDFQVLHFSLPTAVKPEC